jgi:hypothetical protein
VRGCSQADGNHPSLPPLHIEARCVHICVCVCVVCGVWCVHGVNTGHELLLPRAQHGEQERHHAHHPLHHNNNINNNTTTNGKRSTVRGNFLGFVGLTPRQPRERAPVCTCWLVPASAAQCGPAPTTPCWQVRVAHAVPCYAMLASADQCRPVPASADQCRPVPASADWCRLVLTGCAG